MPLNLMRYVVPHPGLVLGTTFAVVVVFGLVTRGAWRYLSEPDEAKKSSKAKA